MSRPDGFFIFVLVSALLEGCFAEQPAPQRGLFQAEQRYSGTLRLGPGRQSLDECWLELKGNAWADLISLASPTQSEPGGYFTARVTLIGRRRGIINGNADSSVDLGFGRLNSYPCLIEAVRIDAVQPL